MDSGSDQSITKLKKRPKILQIFVKLLLIIASCLTIALLILSKSYLSPFALPISLNSQPVLHPQCGGDGGGKKFLWYAPHSGFSNQLIEFKNAILMAAILNRTLIVPPVLDHQVVALGSCPKFRVLSPNEMRFKVWNHSIHLIRNGRYPSMSDIIDLSSLVSISAVNFIDFRTFVSMWCGVNVDLVCAADSTLHSSSLEKLKQCGLLLSGYNKNVGACLYASQEDCTTTVWTYQKDDEDGVLDSFQADDEIKKKRKISFSRTRKDVYKALGPGSAAGQATVLAFGSLFTAPYKGSESHIDIHEAPSDKQIQLLIQAIEYLPFNPEILNAGKKFARQTIKAPFFCVQLRLLDGQFKNRREATFIGVKQKLDLLKKKASMPIHIFIMTDLLRDNRTSSYLGELAKDLDAFRLFVLRKEDKLVGQTAKKLVNAKHSMKFQSVSGNFDGSGHKCSTLSLTDILLYIEETICSCASLGFIRTHGSTISDNIELMRKNNVKHLSHEDILFAYRVRGRGHMVLRHVWEKNGHFDMIEHEGVAPAAEFSTRHGLMGAFVLSASHGFESV